MPNQGVPVIFKNKIAYGYAEQSVKAYDVSVSDYNALTEAQQLDGSIRCIQGVDATPNGSNIWAKIGTTPLAEGLPRDCSQAINELKSNLTDLDTAIAQRLKLTMIRDRATWNVGSSYTFTEEDWNKYTEFHVYIAIANVSEPSYYEIVFNRYFYSFKRIVGYGAISGATYVQMTGDGSNRRLTLNAAKNAGADYNPIIGIYAR